MMMHSLFGAEPIRPAGFVMSLVPFRVDSPRASDQVVGDRSNDSQFAAMDRAFARCGGWTSGDEVARMLRRRCDQPLSSLARWIVTRKVVSFEWQGQTLVPLFQFDLSDMSLRPGALEVIAELVDSLDDAELALWFATPNTWLHGATPVACIADDPSAALRAARAHKLPSLIG